MASKNIEFRVGVIILIGIVILAGSLYWLQGYKLKANSQRVLVLFDDVGTLAAGDGVTVSGVRKGKVNDLRLTPQGVEVELWLSQDVMLKKDAQIVIKNLGLMGERFVAITPGRDQEGFDFSRPARGLYDTGLPEVMGLMGEMITELRNLVISFKRTVGSDSSLSLFSSSLENLQQVSSSLAGYMERNEAKLDRTAENFLSASKELNLMLKTNRGHIDSSLQRADRVTASLEQMVGRLDTLSISAREFADNLNNPEGTLQLLIEDRRLYDDLRKTADNIDDLVNDIRANPRKYINLTLEIF
ncbi:MAG: MlaD family protein [candidate division Zixibacteria bacterium]|nr:MlaD family protein [candidate division Zixibacteria bacterium]MDH3937600.1 MlaD family protein [candidate division Zixibacteria bacterium]